MVNNTSGSALDLYKRLTDYYSEAHRNLQKTSLICKALNNMVYINSLYKYLLLLPIGTNPRPYEQEYLNNNEWAYNLNPRPDGGSPQQSTSKPVICITVATGEVQEFPSVSACSRALGVAPSTIRVVIKKNYLLLKKYRVFFKPK